MRDSLLFFLIRIHLTSRRRRPVLRAGSRRKEMKRGEIKKVKKTFLNNVIASSVGWTEFFCLRDDGRLKTTRAISSRCFLRPLAATGDRGIPPRVVVVLWQWFELSKCDDDDGGGQKPKRSKKCGLMGMSHFFSLSEDLLFCHCFRYCF